MNRKLWTIIGLCIILVVGGALGIIINSIATRFTPFAAPAAVTTTVSGNGTNAVMVGPYLYFAANFVSTDSIVYRQNEHNRVEYGGIYRLRLNDQGRPTYDNQWLVDQAQGGMTMDDIEAYFGAQWNSRPTWDLRPIVPKVAGFERTAIWVFGDYLVYASPNNRQNRFGELQSARLDFFRVDLTGRNHRLLFTSASPQLAPDDFTVTRVGGANNMRTYLLVNDAGRIVRVSVCTRPGTVTEISTEATSHAFPRIHTYTDHSYRMMGDVMSWIYFTEDRDPEVDPVQGNLLKRFPIHSGNPNQNATVLSNIPNAHFRAMSVANNMFMFTMADFVQGGAHINNRLFVANNAIETNFQGLSALESNFLATRIFQPEESFFTSEDQINNIQRFVSFANQSVFVYTRLANPTADGSRFASSRLSLPPIQQIIHIGTEHIWLHTTTDQILVVNWHGQPARDSLSAIDMNSRTGGSMTPSVFSRIDNEGRISLFDNSLSEMVFYMRTVTSLYDGTTMTIATIVDSQGRSWRLGEIPEEFFQEAPDVEGEEIIS